MSDAIDDDAILLLPDGDSVSAHELEHNLLDALPCLSHALVLGSNRPILVALLVLKTADSNDPNFPLPEEGLSLALQFGSFATTCRSFDFCFLATLIFLRVFCSLRSSRDVCSTSDPYFMKGLMQGCQVANKQAKRPCCLLRKFAVLPAPLSCSNGELGPDGSVSYSAC